MEVKKSNKANLENKRTLFIEVGLLLALLICFVGFEMKSTEKAESAFGTDKKVEIEEENIPITTETPVTPPETPNIPLLSDQIDIVDDDIVIKETFNISSEDTKNMGVAIMDYVDQVYEEDVDDAPIPFALVEEKPSFMGGDANTFSKWVNEHLVYPELAKENGVQGRVTLQFTVNPDGSVSNIKVLRGVDASLDKEAMRVVASSPKWVPGKQRDRAVKVIYNFPIIFQLR